MIFIEIVMFFLISLLMGKLFKCFKLPELLGFLITGLVIGFVYREFEYDMNILEYKSEITKIALATILLKAGFGISRDTLKKVGFRAGLLGVVPNVLEASVIAIVSSLLISEITIVDGFILGFIVSAVSPAVIIPSMTKIKDEGYGIESGLPTMNLASASIDDVVSLSMFAIFMNVSKNTGGIMSVLIKEPLFFINGIIISFILANIFKYVLKVTENKYIKIVQFIFIMSFMFLLTIKGHDMFINGTIAVMVFGFLFKDYNEDVVKYIKDYTNVLWSILVVFLFFLIGSQVDMTKALDIGLIAILIIFVGLLARLLASYLCLYKSKFTSSEKTFNSIANIPKATVQATIGAIPLSEGLESGNIILSIAVMAILITAPIGLILIEASYKKMLNRSES